MTIEREGEPLALSGGVQLAVFRVAQEALTNTLKHATRPAHAHVALRCHSGRVELEAGPRPEGGWRIHLSLAADAAGAGGDPAMTTGILIADDQELMRMGFRMVIESQDDLAVVGEASTGREAIDVAARLRPDVVLMDVRMPETDGVEATRVIAAAPEGPRIIILTTFDLDECVYAALRAGASGFLLKDTPPADMLSAIRAVFNGDVVVAPKVTRRLLTTYSHRLPGSARAEDSERERLEALTAREYEVLLQVARSLSNAEIAERLVLSEATMKSHVGCILAKLELRDRVQIVVFAYETGLITPSQA